MADIPIRKLVVVLHADVVGSTGLVKLNETLAHERIRDVFFRFSQVINSYNGIAHEVRGDALVAEFSRVSDAISASLVFQASNATHNEGLADEIRPVVRVGIALGEVVVADQTVTGEGVVLAQRLEQLAEGGGLCIQGAAYETVPKRLPFNYESMGDHQLKGFDEAIRAYAVSLKSGATVPEPEVPAQPNVVTSPELPDKPSIAVLPFTNMSGNPEQEYFSDGITEDIITALSRISDLLVIARNSTMVYKNKAVDIKRVGREQGVRYVLEGSVRKAGNRVRVTSQLINATTGHHMYAERFDRELDDIFAVQDEITKRVTVELQVQLTSGEQARLWAGSTNSVDAWEHTLRANELMGRHIREDNHAARAMLENAISLDPKYATAWSTLGMTHWEDARWGWSDSREVSLDLAEEAARSAEKIDHNYPGCASLLGLTYLMRGRHVKALAMMEKAVRMAPNHAANVALHAVALNLLGKPGESIRQIKRAMRLSPIYPAWYLVPLAVSYLLKGELDRAHKALSIAIDRDPESNLPRIWLTYTLIQQGRQEDAENQAQVILDADPDFSVITWSEGINFKDANWNKKLEQGLREAKLPR